MKSVSERPNVRLKAVAEIRASNVDKLSTEGERSVRLCNYVDVYKNDRITSELPFMEATATRAQIERFGLRSGDVIITKDSETPKDIAVPALVDSSAEGVVCGYHLALLRPLPSRLVGSYLFWALKADAVAGQFASRAQGITRYGLTVGAIGDIRFPLPPLPEQRAIADFLDRETAKIDVLIAKQEELIQRVEEKFRAVLDHAICFGVRTNPALRDSGSYWLGRIPSHWAVKPLMRLTPDDRQIMYGIVLPGPDVPDGVPIVKGGDVAPDRLRLSQLKRTTKEIEAVYARSRLRGGDLVYAIRGSIGAVERVPDELTGANLTQDAARVSPRSGVNPDWLLYALRSAPVFQQLEAGAVGATIRGINIRDLKRVLIPVPPSDEQDEISDRLRHAAEAARNAIALAHSAVETMIEHRSALITAAITGRINGRVMVSKPSATVANDNRKAIRAAVGAEIVSRHGTSKAFGRVKLQKLLYLAEVHAGVGELGGTYTREAAGPLARDMLAETEQGMATAGYYRTVAPANEGEGYTYSRIGKAGDHKNQFTALIGDRAEPLTKLIDLLKDYDTKPVEAITTLYAVWNDALLDGESPDDDRIVRGVLEEWHPEKKDKFTASELKTWLAFMRRNGLVPTGSGSRTQIDRLFV